jgi:hypothetical protein
MLKQMSIGQKIGKEQLLIMNNISKYDKTKDIKYLIREIETKIKEDLRNIQVKKIGISHNNTSFYKFLKENKHIDKFYIKSGNATYIFMDLGVRKELYYKNEFFHFYDKDGEKYTLPKSFYDYWEEVEDELKIEDRENYLKEIFED